MNKTIKTDNMIVEMKRKSGFTLVELLIVIAIMSILTVITVAQFQNARKKARDVQRKADISSLSKALEMYFADYGRFPDDVDGTGQIFGATWGGEFVDGGYVYMKVLPKENSLDVPYCYMVSADFKMFGLFTQLENDQDSDYNKMNGGDPYHCNGEEYNFAILSPNTDIVGLGAD